MPETPRTESRFNLQIESRHPVEPSIQKFLKTRFPTNSHVFGARAFTRNALRNLQAAVRPLDVAARRSIRFAYAACVLRLQEGIVNRSAAARAAGAERRHLRLWMINREKLATQ